MNRLSIALATLAAAALTPLISRADLPWQNRSECGAMTYWDITQGMCEPLTMPGMPMRMQMLTGNIFGVRTWAQGPRGTGNKDAWYSTNMIMGDLGTSAGQRQYLNMDLMVTTERWTVPESGYPLLLQIGEENSDDEPYIDAQHPHSSPIMGLTFSDTITLSPSDVSGDSPPSEKNYVKFSIAPRGESTDGPVAFVQRATGMVNPNAPLGHHVGQDVGHITSTVLAADLQLGKTRYEVSGYHGAEPSPTSVDLPLGKPDSVSFRLIEQLAPGWVAMASAARVKSPEANTPIDFEGRYSASAYWFKPLSPEWMLYNTFIYGAVTQYDNAASLSSFAEEFLFQSAPTESWQRIWGRLELLQRTPTELGITSSTPNSGEWVSEITLGYTHRLWTWQGADLALGGSATKDLLPGNYVGSYGGNPWSGAIFLQLAGRKMWAQE